ncbi:MAG TPA: hypothetical protein VFY10_07495 [Dehalococcoidia bacterium]|nr:hypothetical protein [Dehalococcoidia bacterium]
MPARLGGRGSIASLCKALLRDCTRPVVALMVILSIVTVAYLPTLNYALHGDDYVALLDMLTKSTSRHIWDAFTFQDTDFYWRPLGHVYYNVTYLIAGFDSRAFHAANLIVFLVTLVGLYHFCLRFGLSAGAALVTVLFFGIFPNQVVSVAWVTNGPRLVAMMFFVFSLLCLQGGISRSSFWLEALAWLCFLLACLCDEVSLALAPVPVLFSLYVHGWQGHFRPLAFRTLAYGLVAVLLIPPQFMFTLDDEPRLRRYHLSLDVLHQGWALTSQLVLPLARSNPMDVPLSRISDAQWAGGALAIAAGVALLIFGTWRMRLLVVWLAAALSPFVLWDIKVESPRYVYMAGIPLAIIVGILTTEALARLKRPYLRITATGFVVAALAVMSVVGVYVTNQRNNDFERSARPYHVLATGLKQELPDLPHGARVVIHDGVWNAFWVWPQVTVQAEYRDTSLRVVSVPPNFAAPPPQPGDIQVYYRATTGSFTTAAPSVMH